MCTVGAALSAGRRARRPPVQLAPCACRSSVGTQLPQGPRDRAARVLAASASPTSSLASPLVLRSPGAAPLLGCPGLVAVVPLPFFVLPLVPQSSRLTPGTHWCPPGGHTAGHHVCPIPTTPCPPGLPARASLPTLALSHGVPWSVRVPHLLILVAATLGTGREASSREVGESEGCAWGRTKGSGRARAAQRRPKKGGVGEAVGTPALA